MKDDPKKILLLGATFNTGNMGVGALADGALSIIEKKHPDAEVMFLDYGKKSQQYPYEGSGRKRWISLINLRYTWKIILPNSIVFLLILAVLFRIFRAPLGKMILQNNSWLKEIDNAELALAISGGDSFSDIYGIGRFFYVAFPQILVIIMGRKLVLLPQTIGPFTKFYTRSVAGWIMKHSQIVYGRDKESVRLAQKIVGDDSKGDKIRFCYDVGFLIDPLKPRSFNCMHLFERNGRRKPLVGINVSGLLISSVCYKNNMLGGRFDYLDLIVRIVEMFIVEKDAEVVLIPHVFGEHQESDVKAVNSICKRLEGMYQGCLFGLAEELDQNEVKYVIGLCDFFVGSRMHACIAALSQGIPSVGIAYSRKFKGVLESIGVMRGVVDPRYMNAQEILAFIDNAFGDRQKTESHLLDKIPVVKDQIFDLLNGV